MSFGLVTGDGHLTNAGALFADDCSLSQSRLYCTRWSGLEKDDAINDAEYKGNVLSIQHGLMTKAEADAFIADVRRMGSFPPKVNFDTYICTKL